MDIMLDSLNLDAIKTWKEFIPLAGVTSNPSIARMEGGRPFFQQIRQVRDLVGDTVPIHVQVIAQDYEGILADAARIRQECGPGTYIKVPTTKEGLAAIQSLKNDGYFVTATAIYTAFQGLLAIEAGADYLAPYFNRMENLDIDPEMVIGQLWQVIEREKKSCKILAASFKNVGQVSRAVAAGAQAVTVSPDLLEAGLAHPSIAKAVDDFAKDWEASYQRTSLD